LKGGFGKTELGAVKFGDFVDRFYLPWAKANKRSWNHTVFD
jgi:hypothetical protein